jgi:hypothetical protein
MGEQGQNADQIQGQLDRIRRYYDDWTAEQFEKTAEFTNRISFAGYTGGFATWILLKGFLSRAAMDWVGCLLLISLATFVGWNVFNMIWIASQRLQSLEQLRGLQGDAVRLRHIAIEADIRRRLYQLYLPAWITVVVVCIVTALIAFGVLLVSAAADLLELSV